MNDQNHRSALQVVADAARKIKAAARIVRAALVGGLHGAAIAAAKEALPTVVKFAVGFVIVVVVIPMFVISAMPNMFFGYETSEKDPQITMREQALSIGGAYLSLEDFEKTQQDAIITGEVAAYENQGVTIDEIRVSSKFDEDAKTWAGALFETIYESDALGKYKDKFEAYKPNYAGDTGYTGPTEPSPGGGGGAESGGNADNTIDISGFTNPRTKNNHDLAAYAIQAWEHGWGYVWGTFGNVLTESMLQYKLEQYPDIGASEAFIREHWLGRRTTDCVGLLKGYGWLNPDTLAIDYNTNGMPDYNADRMYASAKENGTEYGGMDTMPDIVGLGLWKQGHWGVYVGNGYAIEAMGTQYGVVRTKVEGRGWQGWCKIPYIQYDD